jgi:hypothetical protein
VGLVFPWFSGGFGDGDIVIGLDKIHEEVGKTRGWDILEGELGRLKGVGVDIPVQDKVTVGGGGF